MRKGTLKLTAPLALDWVVVDFGQTVPRPDHDLIQLRMPETANHTLEGETERERDVEEKKKTGRKKKGRIKSFGTSKGNTEKNSDEKVLSCKSAAVSR